MFDPSKLNPKELVVYSLIKDAPERITQLEICRHEKWLGSHIQEKHLPIDHEQSTLRQIRQIIRTLRFKDAPILSDIRGYWIPRNDDEVHEYITRTSKVSQAQARAWNATYKQMIKVFGDDFRDEFLDKQGTLFD